MASADTSGVAEAVYRSMARSRFSMAVRSVAEGPASLPASRLTNPSTALRAESNILPNWDSSSSVAAAPPRHGGYAPGALDTQNAPVKFPIFHGYWMDNHAVGGAWPDQARWGAPPGFGGVGGTPPPPASPGGGKGERGRLPSLLPEAIAYPLRPEPPSSRPPPQ